ncbi:MAG: GNAT family N-acetyltransferase [Bacteroidales bacterium]
MTESRIKDEFLVRPFREDDFELVAALWKQTEMGNPERGDDCDTILETIRLGGKLLILEDISSGRIAGTSWLTFDGRRIFLHHFGILPEFQGKGLSKFLLGESLRFVKSTGYQVKLEVHTTNKKAIKLYESFGFRYLGDYLVYIIRDVPKMDI